MLNKKQKKCLELMAIGELSQKEIANQIKVSEQTICNWKKDKEFITELDLLIRTSIQSLAAKADNKVKFEGAIPIVIKDDMGEDDE